MSQQYEGRSRPFQAAATISQFARVKDNGSGKITEADSTERDYLGYVTRPVLAADDYVDVALRTLEGTQKMIASGAISAHADVYADDDGKVASSGTVIIGEAMEAATADGDIIEVLPTYGQFSRGNITQQDLEPYAIPITAFRTWDDFNALPPGTAAADDLAVIEGTIGTDAPKLQSADAGGTTVTAYTRFQFPLPVEYVDGETIALKVNAEMQVVSDGTATLDAQVYAQSDPTTDICATAAQSINSATAADKTFTITPTGMTPGEILDVRLAVAITDSGNAADYIHANINKVSVLLDVKG